MGTITVSLQRTAAGQSGSPPPETVAVLLPLTAESVGVTGITKLAVALTARPVGIVQVTTWSAAPHPAGSMPMVNPLLMVSLIDAGEEVGKVPVFCTVIV